MSDLITDAMVEAAADSLRDRLLCTTDRTRRPAMSSGFRESVRAALEAVAPAVAVRVLRAAGEAMADTDDPDAIYMDNGDAELWLRAYTDRIERGES